jgi:hypothetical protein
MNRSIRQIVLPAALLAPFAVSPSFIHTARAQSGGAYSRPAPLPSVTMPANRPDGTGGAPLAKFEPANGVYHGASVPQTWDNSGLRQQVAEYQKYAGKRLSVVTWFASAYENGRMTSWRNEYSKPLRYVQAAGALSLIKFSVQDHSYNQTKKIAGPKQVAQGTYDAYFEEAADAVRDFGGPVFISINHEMNGTWYPYSEAYPGSGVTAQDFIASWRRIVDIFRRKGANNAAFVWSPNLPDVGGIPFTSYYPGDDYVDWVGASFYSGNPMSNMQTLYKAYAAKKPIFITEWATGEDKSKFYQGFPGDAKWIASFFSALERNYPRVKAISWFQWDKRQYGESDYTLQRNPVQTAQYQQDIQNPRYLDDAGTLIPPRSGIEKVPVQVVPREIILRESPPVQQPRAALPPAAAPPVERVRSERPRLQIIPRERVMQER